MSRTDLIADVFTIIRNAVMARKDNVDVPSSNTIKSILEILKKENYIDNFKIIQDNKQDLVRIYLKYIGARPAIRNIKRISRPGLRHYVRRDEVPSVLRGKGIAIISSSQGIITDQQARDLGVGGEVVGYIW